MKVLAQSDLWRFEQVARTKPMITNGKSRVLGKFRQKFPFTLFPDNLIVEELRIIHVKNIGPWATEINSIMATDIACVNASAGPFFGHVHIKSLTGGPEIFINSLKRADVYRIRSLVEGIALASREGLSIEADNLATEREELLRAGSIA